MKRLVKPVVAGTAVAAGVIAALNCLPPSSPWWLYLLVAVGGVLTAAFVGMAIIEREEAR